MLHHLGVIKRDGQPRAYQITSRSIPDPEASGSRIVCPGVGSSAARACKTDAGALFSSSLPTTGMASMRARAWPASSALGEVFARDRVQVARRMVPLRPLVGAGDVIDNSVHRHVGVPAVLAVKLGQFGQGEGLDLGPRARAPVVSAPAVPRLRRPGAVAAAAGQGRGQQGDKSSDMTPNNALFIVIPPAGCRRAPRPDPSCMRRHSDAYLRFPPR